MSEFVDIFSLVGNEIFEEIENPENKCSVNKVLVRSDDAILITLKHYSNDEDIEFLDTEISLKNFKRLYRRCE